MEAVAVGSFAGACSNTALAESWTSTKSQTGSYLTLWRLEIQPAPHSPLVRDRPVAPKQRHAAHAAARQLSQPSRQRARHGTPRPAATHLRIWQRQVRCQPRHTPLRRQQHSSPCGSINGSIAPATNVEADLSTDRAGASCLRAITAQAHERVGGATVLRHRPCGRYRHP